MKYLKLVVLALIVVSCTEKQKPLAEGFYRINGTVQGLENGELYIMNYPNPADTVKVENGKFTVEKEIKTIVESVGFAKDLDMRGMKPENSLNLFIEPKEMVLNLNYEDFSKSKLSGSATQDDQYRLDALTNEVAKDYEKELAEFKAVGEEYKKATKAGASADELEAIKYKDNDCRTKLAPMWEKQGEISLQFIKDNPKSFVSVQGLAFNLRNLNYEEAKAIFDQLNPEHLKVGFGVRLAADIENMRKGIPGAKAGDFNTTDINGKPLKLADFKGKYVLIDFWASWCVPCRKGNPHLIEVFHKYNSKGLEILGVSDDGGAHDKWRKAVKKDQIGIWYHVLRGIKYVDGRPDFNDKSTDITEGYNISSLPTKILVGPDGIILGRFGGGGGTDADMDKMLAEIFEK